MAVGLFELLGDSDIRILGINETGAQRYDLTPDLMTRKSLRELGFPEEAIGRMCHQFREARDKGRPVTYEFTMTKANGTELQLATTISPPTDGVYSLVCEDLAGLRGELISRDRLLTALIANIPGMVFRSIVDDDWRLEFLSESVVNILGYTADDFMTGRVRFRDIVPATDYGKLQAVALEAVDTESEYVVEYRIRRKDGKTLWLQERGRVAHEPVSHQLVLDGAIFDVTDRREAELALDQSVQDLIAAREAAIEASRLKSEFLANMSHEIRTPMNGVLGMTELLQSTELSEVQQEFVDALTSSAESLLAIISDILDFSKIEAGRLVLDEHETDIAELCDGIGTTFARDAHSKDLEFVVDLANLTQPRRVADPMRLRQILSNLVSNAIKFTAEGEVILRASDTTGKAVKFEVIDTGIGIEHDKFETIFQSFTQGDGSSTRRFGGAGLGLAIVRRLVELMGGSVGVASQPGHGSTFWFEIDLNMASSPAVESLSSQLMGKSVLVVDDNETNRRVVIARLKSWGCTVLEADQPQKGLAELRERTIDLVILDFQMPDLDGLDFVKILRQDSGIVQPTVIMLSSLGETLPKDVLEQWFISANLSKPVRHSDLQATIERALTHRQLPEKMLRASEEQVAPLEGMRILLVEDSPINQQVATRLLQKAGCSVSLARNGLEGVEANAEDEFDAILMDLSMPVLDGLEATVAIRNSELQTKRHVPICALTAHALPRDRARCFAVGMDAYLSKPVRYQELISTLEQWHNKSRDASLAA